VSTTRCCDRCEAVSAGVLPRRRVTDWSTVRVSWEPRVAPDNFDLCDSCTKLLREFLDNG
jgi:hypothetical protein